MLLTQEQQHKLVDRLLSLLNGQFRCPICKGDSFSLADRLYALVELDSGRLVYGAGRSVVPTATITCGKCGYTILLNAVAAGLVSNGRDKDGPSVRETPGERERRGA